MAEMYAVSSEQLRSIAGAVREMDVDIERMTVDHIPQILGGMTRHTMYTVPRSYTDLTSFLSELPAVEFPIGNSYVCFMSIREPFQVIRSGNITALLLAINDGVLSNKGVCMRYSASSNEFVWSSFANNPIFYIREETVYDVYILPISIKE